eukprot:XP_014785600.1 PREDICTED: uncharacterized protein LOC106880249 [Octopus bimaculoides]
MAILLTKTSNDEGKDDDDKKVDEDEEPDGVDGDENEEDDEKDVLEEDKKNIDNVQELSRRVGRIIITPRKMFRIIFFGFVSPEFKSRCCKSITVTDIQVTEVSYRSLLIPVEFCIEWDCYEKIHTDKHLAILVTLQKFRQEAHNFFYTGSKYTALVHSVMTKSETKSYEKLTFTGVKELPSIERYHFWSKSIICKALHVFRSRVRKRDNHIFKTNYLL